MVEAVRQVGLADPGHPLEGADRHRPPLSEEALFDVVQLLLATGEDLPDTGVDRSAVGSLGVEGRTEGGPEPLKRV